MAKHLVEEIGQAAQHINPFPTLLHSAGYELSHLFISDLQSDAELVGKPLPCGVTDLGARYEVVAKVPGLTAKDLKVSVSPDNVLHITGQQEVEALPGKDSTERAFVTLVRRFRLPPHADVSGIEAHVDDGVLKIDVPKLFEPKHRDVPVKEDKK